MKTARAMAFAPLLLSVSAQNFIRMWRDEGCPDDPPEENYLDLLLPTSSDGCIGGTAILADDWPTDSEGEYIVYITGEGIGDGCEVALLRQSTLEPGACGEAYVTINAGTAGQCRQTTFGQNGSIRRCCAGETCSPAPATAARVSAIDGSSSFSTADDANTGASSDLSKLKRGSPFQTKRQDDCSFSPNGAPYDSRGSQQIVTATVTCASGETSCAIEREVSITTGSTNSFGASVEVGASFFEIIQASTSFSYEYTFSEEQSVSTSYTIPVPAGQTGAISWTPRVQCVAGTFNGGGCGGWITGEEKVACIPAQVNGQPDGAFAFVREI